MEKFEPEIENPSGAVAVLEREENKEELENKIVALAEEYLSFNNNETKLEKDLNDMLEKINSLEETSPSSEFLKGQLCLELYDIYKNSPDASVGTPTLRRSKEKNDLADVFLEQANENFSSSAEGEDFEIKIKNKEGEEMTFASKSHSLAYLGDIAAKDFYESDSKADWDKNLEYYKEAIEAEPDEGKKHELEAILGIRKITADFSLEYASDKNGNINKYIDATRHLRKEKIGKQEWSDTGVFHIDKEIADFLAEIDFDSILEEVNEKGELSDKNKELFRATLRCALAVSVGLEKALEDELKNNTDSFRNDFYRSLPKLKKFLPKYSEEEIGKIMFE